MFACYVLYICILVHRKTLFASTGKTKEDKKKKKTILKETKQS